MTVVPVLYHFRVSHYNEKVRWVLDYKRWPHRRKTLIPGFHIPRARLLSGQNMLPVLRLGERTLHDSSTILAELERLRPDPPLFPSDEGERRRALEIEAWYDDPVAPDLRRLFWATYLDDGAACTRMSTDGAGSLTRAAWRVAFPAMRPLFRRNMGVDREHLERAHERLEGYFDRLASEIGPSGFLVGDRFSIADLAAAAVMTAIIRPPEFPYPLPEPWPEALVALRESVARKPAFQWVLELYARHRGRSFALE